MRGVADWAILAFAGLLVTAFPGGGRADPCADAPAQGLVVFDTVNGLVKVDRAYLGDPFFGVEGPSMTPTFSLWYPDGTPIDLKGSLAGKMRSCDSDERFVVAFRLDETPKYAKPYGALATIERVRANLRDTGSDLFQGFASADHNLDGPVSGERDYFVMDDLGDRIAILTCTAWHGNAAPPRPMCDGLIGFMDRGLAVYAKFPAQMGFDGTTAKWRDIADFIDAQIALWRMEGPVDTAPIGQGE